MTATPRNRVPSAGPPPPLTVAASLVVVEALVFVVLGVTEFAALEAGKAVMGATTAIFFFGYSAGLALCAWAVYRLKSWARAPIVVAQLLQLAVAWSFRGGQTMWVAIGLAVVALIVLGGVLHPQSLDALAEEGTGRPGPRP